MNDVPVRIVGLGRAVPATRYTQRQLYAYSPWEPSPLLDKLFLDSQVASRALVVPPSWYGVARDLGQTNSAWREGALSLAGEALLAAVHHADTTPEQLGMIGVTTVTGYTTPGLDLLLARDHGLPPNVARLHLNCIGCHAAVPLLRSVADHARSRPGTQAVAVAVEVCSACFAEDDDPQNLVALSLFGDGAAAVVLSTDGEGPELVDFSSAYDFEHIEALGFELTPGGFRIVLDPSIPQRIAAAIDGTVRRLLQRHDLFPDDIHTWCFHPGGAAILDAVQAALSLPDEQLVPSRRVLRGYGNMSSPSVLFVLAEALAHRPPPPGAWGLMAAFGPGLGIEVGLLRF
jgi:alkylresorcinol/alkylpyrone synthase